MKNLEINSGKSRTAKEELIELIKSVKDEETLSRMLQAAEELKRNNYILKGDMPE